MTNHTFEIITTGISETREETITKLHRTKVMDYVIDHIIGELGFDYEVLPTNVGFDSQGNIVSLLTQINFEDNN